MTTTTKTIFPASLLCDFYKVSHKDAYPKGTTKVYSTFTPRSNKYMPIAKSGAVVFGIQMFVQKYLVNYFNTHFFERDKADVIAEYVRYMKFTLGIQEPDASHIAGLHDLGYLPVEMKALAEGTIAPMQVPFLTLENTHDDFFWVTNYLETILSNEIWLPITSATFAHEMRKMVDKFALETTGSTEGTDFQLHDFSMRGMASFDASVASGMAHLLSSWGTDTIVAIAGHEEHYGANIETEMVGASIPATEHSVMTALTPTDGSRDEREAIKHLMTEVYPSGLFSFVADSYDFWKVIEETLPSLYDEIMARDGKVVVRPDSGDPADILCGKVNYDADFTNDFNGNIKDLEDYIYEIAIEWANNDCNGAHNCGNEEYLVSFKINDKIYSVFVGFSYNRYDKTYYYVESQGFESEGVKWDTLDSELCGSEEKGLIECLWNTFGGTITPQGYKVLDPHIGAIYGDSITYERAQDIMTRLKKKGFASTNIVFGIGSYSYQGKTRDSLGMAMKATYAEIDGVGTPLMKQPKTDLSKSSQRGKIVILQDSETGKPMMIDGLDSQSIHEYDVLNMLQTVFKNGKATNAETLSKIRTRLTEERKK